MICHWCMLWMCACVWSVCVYVMMWWLRCGFKCLWSLHKISATTSLTHLQTWMIRQRLLHVKLNHATLGTGDSATCPINNHLTTVALMMCSIAHWVASSVSLVWIMAAGVFQWAQYMPLFIINLLEILARIRAGQHGADHRLAEGGWKLRSHFYPLVDQSSWIFETM